MNWENLVIFSRRYGWVLSKQGKKRYLFNIKVPAIIYEGGDFYFSWGNDLRLIDKGVTYDNLALTIKYLTEERKDD